MITIQNLEIQVEVEGGDDEQVFAKLFNEYIRRWSKQATRQREQSEADKRSRSLVDSGNRGDTW